MKRIPLNIIQAAVFKRLSKEQSIPVYDDVPENPKAPYITFGAFVCAPDGAKGISMPVANLTIDVWSNYQGKKEVNTIANNIIKILMAEKLDLSGDNFATIEQQIESFEAFEEDAQGYHGVINFTVKAQDKEVSYVTR